MLNSGTDLEIRSEKLPYPCSVWKRTCGVTTRAWGSAWGPAPDRWRHNRPLHCSLLLLLLLHHCRLMMTTTTSVWLESSRWNWRGWRRPLRPVGPSAHSVPASLASLQSPRLQMCSPPHSRSAIQTNKQIRFLIVNHPLHGSRTSRSLWRRYLVKHQHMKSG